jgi:hypothetical protein
MNKPEYKWSKKPTFKIDFNQTLVQLENIDFKIIIKAGINTKLITVTRTIDSFIAK